MTPKTDYEVKTFQSPVPFELYLPQTRPPFPLICLTPILGRFSLLEDLFFERQFARFFSKHGFACALIDRPIFEFDPSQGLEQIQKYIEESLIRNQKAVDYLSAYESIDPKKMATFGISFGAVVNCLWAAQEPRFSAHLFALGGGNLPEIFLSSRDPLMRSYLDAALKHSKLERNELKAALQKIFKLEPLQVVPSISKGKTLLVLALFDRVVPFSLGLELRKALSQPKTIILPLGHYTSILAIPLLKRIALKFFREKFKP